MKFSNVMIRSSTTGIYVASRPTTNLIALIGMHVAHVYYVFTTSIISSFYFPRFLFICGENGGMIGFWWHVDWFERQSVNVFIAGR